MCSEDYPDAPPGWKYIACPNEIGCGARDIYPKYNETTIREHEKYNVSRLFLLEDVCAYVIHAPEEMQELDIFYMEVFGIVNAEIYVMKQHTDEEEPGRIMWFHHLQTFMTPT